jgi:hypothetical protein
VCAAGYGTPANGSSQACQLCSPGTYASMPALAACTACGPGPGYTSAPGAKAASECHCLAGYGGPSCILCPAGFYMEFNTTTSRDCVSCASGFGPFSKFTSPPGSTTSNQCACAPGYGGVNCTECERGYWSAGGSNVVCTPCGAGRTTSAKAAFSSDQCVCAAGRGGSACEPCPIGTYRWVDQTHPGSQQVSDRPSTPARCVPSHGRPSLPVSNS